MYPFRLPADPIRHARAVALLYRLAAVTLTGLLLLLAWSSLATRA